MTLLRVDSLTVGYGHVGVLEDVALSVAPGTLVALIGSNGAGKSTLLRAISGILRATRGHIVFDGVDITSARPAAVVAAGLLHVAEGRRLFRAQTVADNLDLGFYGAGLSRAEETARRDEVLELFPVLRDRLHARAGVLSGGQQQMLAIAQALVRGPRLLMLDEPSLGLAPLIVDQVLGVLVRVRESGTTVLLVEQMVERALEIADYGYVLQNGRMIGHGSAAELRTGDLVRRAYLGAALDRGRPA